MTPEEIKDLEARAEEYGKRSKKDFPGDFIDPRLAALDYIAGACAQHEITRKATIDEVLGLLRSKDGWIPYTDANGYEARFLGEDVADWLESKLKVDK